MRICLRELPAGRTDGSIISQGLADTRGAAPFGFKGAGFPLQCKPSRPCVIPRSYFMDKAIFISSRLAVTGGVRFRARDERAADRKRKEVVGETELHASDPVQRKLVRHPKEGPWSVGVTTKTGRKSCLGL